MAPEQTIILFFGTMGIGLLCAIIGAGLGVLIIYAIEAMSDFLKR